MLIDTDILIWYLRGNRFVYDFIEKQAEFRISMVTYAELIHGMRNKREMNIFKKQLQAWNTQIMQINEEISLKAMYFVERYFLSHSLQLLDAIIGATAVSYCMPLVSTNVRHYSVIPDLEIIKIKI